MIKSFTLTTFWAIWGAVVSTIAITWNVWRDLTDRGKLDIMCYMGLLVGGVIPDEGLKLIYRVTNVGRKPVVLTHIGGGLTDKRHFMITAVDLPKTLQPGDYYLNYSNDLSILDQNPTALWAIDSLNRHWKIPKKMLRQLLTNRSKT
jgi:hypothetical protein